MPIELKLLPLSGRGCVEGTVTQESCVLLTRLELEVLIDDHVVDLTWISLARVFPSCLGIVHFIVVKSIHRNFRLMCWISGEWLEKPS